MAVHTTQAIKTRPPRASNRGAPGMPSVAHPSAVLYRHSVWLFVAFGVAVLVAFWPSYFSRLTSQPTFHAHAHGMTMTLWCGLLIAQAWLIRSGRRPWHRRLGTLSYALVPLIVMTTLMFLHARMQGASQLGNAGAYLFALIFNALVAFVVIYGLAMYHRHQPAIHGRYMLCTIFPLFTPVTDRLIAVHAPALVSFVPRVDGLPVLPVVGFALANVMLIGLSIWDWRTNQRAIVFPVALGILLLYHVSVLTFHRWPWWHAFGEWWLGMR